MLRKIIITVCIVFVLYENTIAQNRRFDAGIILGDPTGLSFKLWDKGYSGLNKIAGSNH